MKTLSRTCLVLLLLALAFQPLMAGGKAEAPAAAAADAPLEFSILHAQAFVQQPESDYLKRAFEELNVKVNFLGIDGSQAEQVTLALATGTTPDVMLLGFLPGMDLPRLVDQDIIRELPQDMIRRHAPYLTALLERVEPTGWGKGMYQGRQYTVPLTFEELSLPYAAGIRSDWLANVGMSLDYVVSIEELEEAFRAFVHGDPNQSGAADTYALTSLGAGLHEWQWSVIFGAWGVRPGNSFTRAADGRAVYSPAQPGYREALRTLARWYEGGLIDPEWVTESPATATEKFGNGMVGYFSGTLGQFTADMIGSSYHPAFKLKQANPDATWQYITQVVGPDGVSGSVASEAVFGWHFVIGSHVSDEKAARILRFYDDVNSDREKWLIMELGFEGEHYYIHPETGMASRTQEQLDLVSRLRDERVGHPGSFRIPSRRMEMSLLTWGPILNTYPQLPLAPRTSINFVPDWPSETAKDFLADMQRVSTEFALNAVMGRVNVDTEWNSYISSLRRFRLDTIESEYNERYQRLMTSDR